MTYLTKQVLAKNSLKIFRQEGAKVIRKELEQLVSHKVMHGKKAESLSCAHKEPHYNI